VTEGVFLNTPMVPYLGTQGELPADPLCDGLTAILHSGFIEFNGVWLFQREFKRYVRDEVQAGVRDASYYEYSKNKFHVEDLCEGDLFRSALSFLHHFSVKWRNEVGTGCDGVVAFQVEDGVPNGAIFTFYTHRKEVAPVIDVSDMGSFAQPTVLLRIRAEWRTLDRYSAYELDETL